jgi:DNA-directed RNA polymerase specialized sigma subunit
MSKNYYVKNDELLLEVVKYKKTGIISDLLGEMILSIAESYASKGSYAGYTWVSDMISEAVLTCIKYISNFNPEKSSNAFAYITQICKNSFKAFIKNQNKHSKIKDLCYKSYDIFIENQGTYHTKAINYEDILISSETKKKRKRKIPYRET